MSRSVWFVIVLALVTSVLVPCGMRYHSAHHGLERRRGDTLESFYFRLMHPGQELGQRETAAHQLLMQALQAERAGHPAAELLVHWQQVADHGLGYNWTGASDAAWAIHDRLVLYAADVATGPTSRSWQYLDSTGLLSDASPWGWRMTAAQWRPSGAARHQRYNQPSDAAVGQLTALINTGTDVVAELARLRLYRYELSQTRGQADPAVPNHAGLADMHAYLVASSSLLRDVAASMTPQADLLTMDHQLATYLAAWPDGNWVGQVVGWRAMLRMTAVRRGHTIAWPDGDALVGAVTRYQLLIDDPSTSAMFRDAVGSLRFAFRRLRPDAPLTVTADPRHGLAYTWHWLTDGQRHGPAAPPSLVDDVLALHGGPDALLAVDPAMAGAVVELAQRGGDLDTAAAALQHSQPDDPRALRIQVELACQRADAAAALAAWEQLCAVDPTSAATRRTTLILAGHCETNGQWLEAVRAYVHADSALDLAIMTEGVIPVDAFAAVVAELAADPQPLLPPNGGGWPAHHSFPSDGADWRDWLRERLAVRLVRQGRLAEATMLLPAAGQRALAVIELELRQQAVTDAVDDAQLATASYAEAAWWYHHGRDLVWCDPTWSRWILQRRWTRGEVPAPGPAGGMLEPHELNELEASNWYRRAALKFEHIAQTWPTSPEAPKALYSAAVCWFWASGTNGMGYQSYWTQRAHQEGWWEHGMGQLRQLAADYPQHELARSDWVARAVSER